MEKEFLVIGLMSGTSLDGLDVAACRFRHEKDKWGYSIEAAESIAYDDEMQQKLKGSVTLSGLDLSLLDVELGKFFGTSVHAFCGKYDLKPLFVGSHGHTVFHQPEKLLTLQIGNPEAISHFSQLPVIANFRLQDVLNGGQGAPLVPYGEHHLFPAYNAFLNLGGIANVALHSQNTMKGFDTCACNMGLNHLARKLGMSFDKNGEVAKTGSMNDSLFRSLNKLDYFQQKGPKSLGYEWFEREVAPLLDNSNTPVKDALHTFTHHIAFQVNSGMDGLGSSTEKVMVTGGGALNGFLMDALNRYGKGRFTYEAPDRKTVEFKEALVFAFLALQRFLGQPNVSSQVTGSKKDVSAGSLHGNFKASIQ
ncbi:MAG: anhydro-N-acetylmuramic acid kinase [Imperialibacter sp.]|uniref:anhydro-N-acetylmuramic acid kinase n=1 Tax=Imperialibacter sp. TaxID=2038411 RepID=UPI0032EF88EB